MYRQPVPVTGVTGAFLHVRRLSLSPKSNSIEPPSNKCPRACTGPPIQDSRPKNICRGQVFFLIAQSSAMRDPTAFTYIYGLCTFTHIFMRSPISSKTLSITRIKFFIIFFFFVSWKFSCYSSLNFKLLSQTVIFSNIFKFLKKKRKRIVHLLYLQHKFTLRIFRERRNDARKIHFSTYTRNVFYQVSHHLRFTILPSFLPPSGLPRVQGVTILYLSGGKAVAIFPRFHTDSGFLSKDFTRKSPGAWRMRFTSPRAITSRDSKRACKRQRDKWRPKADEQGCDVTLGNPAIKHPRDSSRNVVTLSLSSSRPFR